LRAEVLAIDKDLPVAAPQALAGIVAQSVGDRRFEMSLLTAFALVALALAALGIYGVMAHSVTQRSREIGIRMALGANSRLILRMILSGGLRLSLLGVALGVVAALLGTRVLASLIYGISNTDPITLAATATVVLASAALASWVPALRATRVDPAVSLRAE
jgi:ABC-type antimicrobial peptide transport system permease subunit